MFKLAIKFSTFYSLRMYNYLVLFLKCKNTFEDTGGFLNNIKIKSKVMALKLPSSNRNTYNVKIPVYSN